MAFHKFLNNFTAGEWTPHLDGRSDLEKYDNAARVMENVRPLPYGGFTIRSGLKHIARCKKHDTVTRLIPFNFSTGTRFVLEMGDNYIRFFSNGVPVESAPGVPYELATPYFDEMVYVLQFKQINDVMYLTHPIIPPQKLARITDTNWTIATVDWDYPPLREENTSAITLTPAATSGTGVGLVASAPLFDAGHVGAYFEIRYLREGSAEPLDLSGTTGTVTGTPITVKGDWNLVTAERWYGELVIERSYDGSIWEVVRRFLSAGNRNVSASGTELQQCQLRLVYTATGDPYGAGVWTGTAPANYAKATATLECSEAYASGLVKITGISDSVNATCTVIETLADTSATDLWSEGAWSGYRGYPVAVGLFEQRLLFGATRERPTRFWGSRTGDFENFRYSEDDDGALAFDIATTEGNPIQWIESLQRIQIGTAGGEYAASAGAPDEPLTPSNISVRGQSAYGSSNFQPILVNDAVVFLQRQGKRLREMSYDIARGGYVSPDLTLLAEHISGSGFIQLGFARQPDPLILGATGGDLAVMTYNREQNITAWARYVTARTQAAEGGIESVCSIYGSPADEIWCVVRRVINGQLYRSIEKFAPESDDKMAARLLDSYVEGVLTNPFAGTISGIGHLIGETVRLVVVGAVIGDYTVSPSGTITVDPADVPTLGAYYVGLPYTAKVQPMKMDIVMANGPSQGKVRRICELTIRFYKSLGCKFGRSLNELEEIPFRNSGDNMDASPPVFTGDKQVKFPPGHDKSADLFIVQEQPLPFTVHGIAVKAEMFGD